MVSQRRSQRWLPHAMLLCVWVVCAHVCISTGFAGDGPKHATNHEHSPAHDHRFELGFAPGLAYIVSDKELTAGVHFHALAALSHRWALGLGHEHLFGEHSHNTISAVVQYQISKRWSVAVAPGVTVEDSDVLPCAHLESAYAIGVGRFHIGPSFEIAIDPHDVHITLGLHVGVGL